MTHHGRGRRLIALAAAVLVFASLCALGVWQMERRAWKLDLIARVDARVHAAPADPPGPAQWAQASAAGDEYRRVRVRGTFDNSKEALVQAVSELGPGYWVLTPLRTDRGFTVLVNRGFVPAELKAPAARAAGQIAGETTVTGLLRMSEPHGGFLRANRPAQDRWYSRDVAAIAAAKRLAPVAPYFIDADDTPNSGGWPRGGMTVIHFRNSHLSYAITWFGLAAMMLAWAVWAALDRRRRKPARAGDDGPER